MQLVPRLTMPMCMISWVSNFVSRNVFRSFHSRLYWLIETRGFSGGGLGVAKLSMRRGGGRAAGLPVAMASLATLISYPSSRSRPMEFSVTVWDPKSRVINSRKGVRIFHRKLIQMKALLRPLRLNRASPPQLFRSGRPHNFKASSP